MDEATKEQRSVRADPHLHRQKTAEWQRHGAHPGLANSTAILSATRSRVWMSHKTEKLTPSLLARPEQPLGFFFALQPLNYLVK